MIGAVVTAFAVLLWSAGTAGAQSRPSASAQAQPAQTPAAPNPSRPSALGNLSVNSKEPIKIDADRLDVFDKEQRAVFTGSVVAVQGESTIKCAEMAVLYEQKRGQGRPAPGTSSQGEGAIRRIDCKGPVTIVSRTQTATGDNAVFDRSANKVVLTGNVALSEGQNVMLGERIVYDLNTSIANIETTPGGRVRALVVPGSSPGDGGQAGSQAQPQKPQQQGRRAPPTN